LSEAQQSLLLEADALMADAGENPAELNEFQKAFYWEKCAKKYIWQSPGIFLKYYFYGIVQNFWGLGTTLFSQTLHFLQEATSFDPRNYSTPLEAIAQWIVQKTLMQKYFGIIIAIYLLMTYVLSAIGCVKIWRQPDGIDFLPLFGFILYFVILTGSAVGVRFKCPVIPFYSVFSAMGVCAVLNLIKKVPC
jgi:hypothetical protein